MKSLCGLSVNGCYTGLYIMVRFKKPIAPPMESLRHVQKRGLRTYQPVGPEASSPGAYMQIGTPMNDLEV